MLTGEDTAERCFFRCRGKAGKGTLDAGHHFRCDIEIEAISSKKRMQDFRRRFADHRMGARVGWVGRGVGHFRKPIGVSNGLRIDIGICCANRGYRPPEIKRVLGIVEGNHAVGEAQVNQGEQARALRRAQVVSH